MFGRDSIPPLGTIPPMTIRIDSGNAAVTGHRQRVPVLDVRQGLSVAGRTEPFAWAHTDQDRA